MADGSVIIESKMDNKQLESGLNDMQGKLQSAGGKMQDVGKTLTKGLTVPLAAAATGAVKVAMDFESGMSKVQAVSNATDAEMELLTDTARRMGAETIYSATEAAAGLEILAMSGMSAKDSAATLEPVLKLAGAAGLELDEAAGIVTNTLGQFQMEADQATRVTDVMAKGATLANTDVMELGEGLKVAGGGANAMGYDVESSTAILAAFADKGLVGSKAGTALSAAFRDLKKSSKDGAVEINGNRVAIENADGTYREFTDILEDLDIATDGLTDTQKDQAYMSIFGDTAMQGMNLITGEGVDVVKKYENALRNSEGAASDMYDIMQNNLKGSLESMKSALGEVAIQIGEILLPYIRDAVDWITKMAEKFGSLDDKTKANIVKIGLMAAALGPLLLIFGKVLGVVSAVTSAIALFTGGAGAAAAGATAATGAASGLATVLTFLSGPAGLAVLAVGGIVLAGKKLYDHLNQEAIPEVERFGDEVSENTQEAVGAFMDMSEQADVALKELAWSQEEVTTQMAEDMKEQQQNITDTLLEAISERGEEEIAATQEQFANIDSLNEEQKANILGKIGERFEEESAKTQEGHDRINEIVERAAAEERSITDAESKEILRIREDMTKQAVEVMSKNELEQRAILEKMEQNAGTITAREAAEVVKNATKKKDDVIKEANEQYDETIAWAIQQRDEAGILSAEEAADVIKEAEKKRDDGVSAAEDMHKKVVKEAKAQAKDHVNEVDWSTGEIKSKWEIMKSKVVANAKDIKTDTTKYFSDARKDLNKDVDIIKNKATDAWNIMKTNASDNFGDIKGSISSYMSQAASDLSTDVSNMRTKATEAFGGIATAASTKFKDVVTAVSTGMSSAYSAVTDKISDFFNAGKNIAGAIGDGIKEAAKRVTDAASSLASKVRSYLPFSPAKEGPLKDLDKLDFGGPIEDSLKNAIPNVQAEMTHLLKVPRMGYEGDRYNTRGQSGMADNSKKYGDVNLTIVSPENTPYENARQIKRVGKELGLGY